MCATMNNTSKQKKAEDEFHTLCQMTKIKSIIVLADHSYGEVTFSKLASLTAIFLSTNEKDVFYL